jgi:hypothetical protein
MAQRLMVVEVFVAKRDPKHPLPNQRRHRMLDQRLGSPIDKARGQPVHHPDRPIRRAQQQRTRIRCRRASIKRRHHLTTFDGFTSKHIRDTLCRHRALLESRQSRCGTTTFSDSGAPMCSNL